MLNKFTLEAIDDILGDNQDSPHHINLEYWLN